MDNMINWVLVGLMFAILFGIGWCLFGFLGKRTNKDEGGE